MENIQTTTQKKQRSPVLMLVHVILWLLVLTALYLLMEDCVWWTSGCKGYGKLISYYQPMAAYIIVISVVVFSLAFAISGNKNQKERPVVLRGWNYRHTLSAVGLCLAVIFAPHASLLLFLVITMIKAPFSGL